LNNQSNTQETSLDFKKPFYKGKNQSHFFLKNFLQEDLNQENKIKEDKFFITRSKLTKDTQINIAKVFFPPKYKTESNRSSKKIHNLYDIETSNKIPNKINFSLVQNENKFQKNILKPLNTENRTIYNKKEFIPIKNNLTISLNNELSKISSVYGKERSFKKFTDNPITNKFYEERNYLRYEIAKINELRDVHIKPKLKPLVMPKESTFKKLTESLFHIKELGPNVDLNDLMFN
jgi:hypothetical protein